MTTLTFAVENKVVTRTDENSVIGDNINEYNAVFTLDEEWTDTVTAIFSKGSVHKTQILTENSCVIPWEVLVGEGNVSVSVFSGELKTSVPAVFPVVKSGYQRSAITSAVPTPSEYAQIIEAYETLLREISGLNDIGKITEYQTPIYNLETGVYTVDEGGTLLLGDGGELGEIEFEYGIVFVSNEAAYGLVNFLAIGRDNGWRWEIFHGKAVLIGDVWDVTFSVLPQHAENADNRVTSISNESTDAQYPSAKASWTLIQSIIPTVDSPNLWELETGLYWVTGTPHRTSNAVYDLTLLGKTLFIIQNYDNGVRYLRQNDANVKYIRGFVNGWCNGNTTLTEGTTEHTANKALEITSSANNSTYPSAKAVWDFVTGRNLLFTDVSASVWTSDTTYSGYGYKCELSLTGVTPTMIPTVTFAHAEAVSGNYSPVALSGTGTITIYSKVNTTITIPLIKAEVV